MVLCILAIIFLLSASVFAEEVNSEGSNILEKLSKETNEFDPEELGKRLEQKAEDLFSMSKSGSKFYIAISLLAVVFLLIGGLFFKNLVKIAFTVLFVSFVGYMILNYWPQMKDSFISFVDWLFEKGGEGTDTLSL